MRRIEESSVERVGGRAGTARGEVLIATVLGLSLAASLLLYVFRPIANGHAYQLGVRVTLVLTGIWWVGTARRRWLHSRAFLAGVLALGLFFSVKRPFEIQAESEIVHAYRSAFAALDAGLNPYTSQTIVHFDERGAWKLGNFNYPPFELLPYYAVSKLVGAWNHVVLGGTLALLQVVACGLLALTFGRALLPVSLAFTPLIASFELRTNVALTLLSVAVLLYQLYGSQRVRGEWLLMGTFGIALSTKFLVIPLFATYLLHRLSGWRALATRSAQAAVALAVVLASMLPFGIGNVLRETVLFNLVLSERAKLTTFYPNVLSGVLSWLGIPGVFPVLSVLLLGAAILWSRRLPLLWAFVFTGSVFLLVSPTPEPQYIPVMLYLALSAALVDERERERASAEPALAGGVAAG